MRLVAVLAFVALFAAPASAGTAEGRAAWARSDYAAALAAFRPAAEAGDAEARYYVGLIHAKGLGVERDYKAAVRWYRLAADQGHARAEDALALLYFNGWGTGRDLVRAWMWFELARRHFPEGTDKEVAFKSRELVARHMSPEQLKKARNLADGWKVKRQ